MDHTQVLVKTAKGKEEIRSKAFNLSPRLRRLLLLVDGRSTVGATLDRLAALGDDVESQLDALLADGFLSVQPLDRGICSFDDWQAVAQEQLAPDSGRRVAGGARRASRFNLEKAKGFARFVVLGYLGPVGAHRVERIEAARNADQLRAELDELHEILPKLLHKRQAKQLWDQLVPLMESSAPAAPTPGYAHQGSLRARNRARRAFPAGSRELAEGSGAGAAQAELSATILEYAEPLIDAASGAEAQRRAIQMAIICWNAAALPDNRGLDTIAPTLRRIAGGDRQLERELFDIFEAMRARKYARFNQDDRFVVDFSLADTSSGLGLSVVARPLRPERLHSPNPNA